MANKYIKKNLLKTLLILAYSGIIINSAIAATQKTIRIPHFSNEYVEVWETIIYPSTHQKLKMHRHDRSRVLVALTNGTLKITNDKNDTHFLNLKKNHAYFLTKDKPQELHTDQNMSSWPVKVMVIELKNEKS